MSTIGAEAVNDEQIYESIKQGDFSQILFLSRFYKRLQQAKAHINPETSLLLDKDSLEKAFSLFSQSNVKRIAKKEHPLPFSVVKAYNGAKFIIFGGKGSILGSGLFGDIKLAQNIETRQFCLVKIVKISRLSTLSTQEDVYLQMWGILLGYTQYYPSYIKKASFGYQPQYLISSIKQKDYFFMQPIPGLTVHELSDVLKKCEKKLTKRDQIRILLTALHEHKKLGDKEISHRDIKGSNVIITPDMEVRLVDFGVAARIPPTDPLHALDLTQMFTTISELITDQELRKKINPYIGVCEVIEVSGKFRQGVKTFSSELEKSLSLELNQLETPPVELAPLRELRKRKAEEPVALAGEARPAKKARKQ